jgi:hypothetical protein
MEKQKGFNPLFEFHHYWFWNQMCPTFFPFEVCTLEKKLVFVFAYMGKKSCQNNGFVANTWWPSL